MQYLHSMVLVTGATGLVGSHLLLALSKKGHDIRAIYRNSDRIKIVQNLFNCHRQGASLFEKIEWLQADLLDLTSLESACEGIDTIYHCAAYISFDPADHKLLRKINIEGTANLVNVALAAKVDKLCHLGSVATLGDSLNDKPVDETTAWNPQYPGSSYAISKYGAEMEVWRGAQEGLKVSILLPGVILGEDHWDSASGGIIPRAAKGMRYYTPGSSGFVDVKDVARAAIVVAESPKANLQKYLLVGANMSYLEFFKQVAANLKTKPPKRKAPKWIMHILAFTDGLVSKISPRSRELTQGLVDSLFNSTNYSAVKITEDLDFKFTPIEQTIERICTRFKESSP